MPNQPTPTPMTAEEYFENWTASQKKFTTWREGSVQFAEAYYAASKMVPRAVTHNPNWRNSLRSREEVSRGK